MIDFSICWCLIVLKFSTLGKVRHQGFCSSPKGGNIDYNEWIYFSRGSMSPSDFWNLIWSRLGLASDPVCLYLHLLYLVMSLSLYACCVLALFLFLSVQRDNVNVCILGVVLPHKFYLCLHGSGYRSNTSDPYNPVGTIYCQLATYFLLISKCTDILNTVFQHINKHRKKNKKYDRMDWTNKPIHAWQIITVQIAEVIWGASRDGQFM